MSRGEAIIRQPRSPCPDVAAALRRPAEQSPSEARERERSDLDSSAAGATTCDSGEGRMRLVVPVEA